MGHEMHLSELSLQSKGTLWSSSQPATSFKIWVLQLEATQMLGYYPTVGPSQLLTHSTLCSEHLHARPSSILLLTFRTGVTLRVCTGT